MRALNFLPLLIFMLAYIPLAEWSYKKMHGEPPTNNPARAMAVFYLLGCAAWFVIGAVCAIGEN